MQRTILVQGRLFHRLKHSWKHPEGHDSGIKIYNCIVKDKVPLILKDDKLVTWYTCGPTVYDSAHIGHGCNYVRIDLIQRILKYYFKYDVIHLMNITDIDDKIIGRSNVSKTSPQTLARKYETEFLKDMASLNVSKPHLILRVTENIPRILHFINKLLQKGYAYEIDGSVYFEVNKLPNYGKLQKLSQTIGKQTGRKKSTNDFALWKAALEGEPYWESDWGPGRPGWHIECSTLAGLVFGSNVDIHAGGIDLRFPHHENEEAQCCAYFGSEQWVNYWLHTGHLHLRDSDEKMSKSLKNTISINDLDCHPNVFRFVCLMTHYRNNVEFSGDLLNVARNLYDKFKFFFNDTRMYLDGVLNCDIDKQDLWTLLLEAKTNIDANLKDDFDTASVMKDLVNLISGTNKLLRGSTLKSFNDSEIYLPLLAIVNFVKDIFRTFGVEFSDTEKRTYCDNNGHIMEVLNEFRQNVRQFAVRRNEETLLKYCDVVRDKIKKRGITINDYKGQSVWTK